METSEAPDPPAYPPHWEADVVLADGGTARVRPIHPGDAGRLRDFHARLSPETIYLRFFAPHPELSDADVQRFTRVDYDGRVALVATIGGEIVAVVRYDREDTGPDGHGSGTAEVAFVVRDDHQGRGLGSILLEHIAACAAERGISRFDAEVLARNHRMIGIFRDAGYRTQQRWDADDAGTLLMQLDIEPTDAALRVMRAREQRAESRSISRLLSPRSVAVVGASQRPHAIGHILLRNLLDAGFEGPVYPIHPSASAIASVPAVASVLDIAAEVDLAVIAVPAEEVLGVVEQCVRKGVQGLVVVSSGFGETGPEGVARQRELVAAARAGGMRVVGPNCLGVVNTDPAVRLNATLAPVTPGRGRVGFFSQSGALGIALLEAVAQRGIGLSTFVSAGNRADVSGNDLMQFWTDDDDTDVVLLYLESFGNPRKFSRLARRLAREKPVVVCGGAATGEVPRGHEATPLALPDAAVAALLHQVGVIRVPDIVQLFDVAQLLAYQPLPAGPRVAIVGNAFSLGLLARDACRREGLEPRRPVDLGPEAGGAEFADALREAFDDDTVDAIVTVFVPPRSVPSRDVARAVAAVAGEYRKPIVTTFLAFSGLPEQLRRLGPDGAPARGSVPSYPAPEIAARALGHVTRYAAWRARPSDAAQEPPDVDPEAARTVLAAAQAGGEVDTAALLAAYGIKVWPQAIVADVDDAVAAAARFGGPVALKAVAPWVRHRPNLGGVRLDLDGESDLRAAWRALAARLRPGDPVRFVVQPMAPPGVAVVVGTVEDPAFGPVVSFGLAGVATELLADRGYRLAPLSGRDASDLVRSVRAAPLLFGYPDGGAEADARDRADVGALEDLLVRVGALSDDLPELASLEVGPVLVGVRGLAVLHATARVRPEGGERPDVGPRRLRSSGRGARVDGAGFN